MNDLAKFLILIGAVCLIVGIVVLFAGRIPWVGRLPGDIYIRKENFTLYAPLTTGILISVFLSLLVFLFSRH